MKLFFILFAAIFTFYQPFAFSQEISVCAAADLRYAMDDIVKEFNKSNPGIKVNVIYGASGKFYQQITNNAPFDLFFSADVSYCNKLDSLHLTAGKPELYAIGHLVLWSSSLDLSKGLEVLRSPEVKKIAIANPAVAPYGRCAVECLKIARLYDSVKDKLVFGENISQAAQFALTGNADVGLIAQSLALSPEMKSKGKYFVIDEKSYHPLEQSFVILKRASSINDVNTFIKFIRNENVRLIFAKYGFKLPGDK